MEFKNPPLKVGHPPLSKGDFPFFSAHEGLIYFDNAATTQKPQVVLDAEYAFYIQYNAPVHRGVYDLAEQATIFYERARKTAADHLNAAPAEIVFTKGTTEGINFIAQAWASVNLKAGDEILISELEHHSNILPWLRLEKEKGILIKWIPILAGGDLDYDAFLQLLNEKTKLVAITHTSNVLGIHVNLPFISEHARKQGARILIDAAQAIGRSLLDVKILKPDFLVFSGHKMLGPTGIGILYISKELHSQVVPYQVGGGMVASVDFHEAQWAHPPRLFEAGTPPLAQAFALDAAFSYIEKKMSAELVKAHEASLCYQLIEGLSRLKRFSLLGPKEPLIKSGHMVSFTHDRIHAHDIAAYLNQFRICVRAGNQCAQPLHKKLGIQSSVRVSFYSYNSHDEVTLLLTHLQAIEKVL